MIASVVKGLHFYYLKAPSASRRTKVIEHSSIKDVTAVGAGCKVGGEVEATVIEPHSNKQHHGFLGHSWVGQWVNLGAGTSTSDLKNTYGMVRVYYRGARVETRMQFLGSIIGDFSKSAVNTSLFTGKIVGVSSMLYGTVTTNVPCSPITPGASARSPNWASIRRSPHKSARSPGGARSRLPPTSNSCAGYSR